MDSPMVGIAARQVRFTADLTCLLCGRSLGTLDGGSSWPPHGEALLYRPGRDEPTPVAGWWRLRCATCGGALMATEVTSHPVRPEVAVDWTPISARRSHPPNLVVAGRAVADVPRHAS